MTVVSVKEAPPDGGMPLIVPKIGSVDALHFEVQDYEAAEGLAMATTERRFAFDFDTGFNVAPGLIEWTEVAAAEDVTDSPWKS